MKTLDEKQFFFRLMEKYTKKDDLNKIKKLMKQKKIN